MAKSRIMLCNWRVRKAEPSGLFVWFDPDRESVELYEMDPLTQSGVADALEEGDQRSLFGDPNQVNDVLETSLEDDLPF